MAKTDLSHLDLDGLNALIEEASKLRDQKVDERRAELLKQLHALDAISKPKETGQRLRSSPKAMYRAPNGQEWSGRGGIPRVFKELGVQSKADMAEYLIKE